MELWWDLESDLVLEVVLLESFSGRDGYRMDDQYSTIQQYLLTLAAAGLDASCLPILGADVGTTFCMDLGGVAGGGVATGADYTT